MKNMSFINIYTYMCNIHNNENWTSFIKKCSTFQKHADKMVISCSLLVDMFMGFITWLHLVSFFSHFIQYDAFIKLPSNKSYNVQFLKYWTTLGCHLKVNTSIYVLSTSSSRILDKMAFIALDYPELPVPSQYWTLCDSSEALLSSS